MDYNVTGHAIAIRYPDSDIGPNRVAVFNQISRFSGYRASGYRTLTVYNRKSTVHKINVTNKSEKRVDNLNMLQVK